MTKKLSGFFSAALIISLLCSVLLLGGCGDKKMESRVNPTQSENNREKDSGDTEKDSGSTEKHPYSFIPKFEEQVIYDKDGIKLTAMPHPDGANPDIYSKYVMYCKIENNRQETVELLPSSIETKDGFRLITSRASLMSKIEPGKEATDIVAFYPAFAMDRDRDDILFQEYGLGNVLGDFKLNFIILDADTHDHIIEDSGDYIKTEKGDMSYDYSRILSKQPIIDQDGVKIYFVENFIFPPYEKYYRTTAYYSMLLYYENQNEEEFSFDFSSPKINGKEIERVWFSVNYDAKSKGFDVIKFDSDILKENGFDSFESLEFDLEVSKVTYDKEKCHFEKICTKENVLLELSENWKTIEIDQ